MKAMRWNPESLMARPSELQDSVDRMVRAAQRGEQVRVEVERSKWRRLLGRSSLPDGERAQFREGCIKTVETVIWPLPQRGRVLAEIHRRLDDVFEVDLDSLPVRIHLASIYDFAGAWTLAAHLIHAGLHVSVVEGESEPSADVLPSRADVVIRVPIGPAPMPSPSLGASCPSDR